MDAIESVLILFAHSEALRPIYIAIVALAILLGIVLFVKHPFFKVAGARSPKKKWVGLGVAMILVAAMFAILQDKKILQFDESPRCESAEDKVLYLPFWIDSELAPYLGETYQNFSSDCAELAERIAAARYGWTRYITIGLHLMLSFAMVAALTICLANVTAARKKGGLGGE